MTPNVPHGSSSLDTEYLLYPKGAGVSVIYRLNYQADDTKKAELFSLKSTVIQGE